MAVEYLQYDGMTNRAAADGFSKLRRRLTAWYARRARDLPWRATDDPYAIWVSEIMLQQTQVAVVVPYFERFLSAFSTVAALARAPEESVLRHWEGLGYYRRALNLHRAAQVIVGRHGGRLPQDPKLLRSLPGIGRYTAGAILSIAFGRREPILEANSRRVLVRLFARHGDATRQPLQGELWSIAHAILPRRNPGRFNQALMELGAEVCLPARPGCDECPLERQCQARQQGIERDLPSAGSKPRIEQVREAAVVVRRGGRALVMRRPRGARWAGMFDFPRVILDQQNGRPLVPFLVAEIHALTGIRVEAPQKIGQIRHSVTRFRIRVDCYEARIAEPPSQAKGSRARRVAESTPRSAAQENGGDERLLRWVTAPQLRKLPMSVPARRLAELAFRRS